MNLGGDRIIIIMIPSQKSWHNHFDVNAFSGRVVGAVISPWALRLVMTADRFDTVHTRVIIFYIRFLCHH